MANNLINLKKYLKNELPKINTSLETEIKSLPPFIYKVAKHVLNAGGKRLRPLLTILTARALGYNKKDIYPLASALEIFHSATLIHDDILDNAHLRRGKTASHLVFGIKESILAGDGLLALGNLIVARYNNPYLTHTISEAILATAYGEIQEISLSGQNITETTYLEIIKGKTAFLIQAACECGAILSGRDKEFILAAKNYGLNIGIAFQLVDDALDYTQNASTLGKPNWGDLKEGKITLPLILYLKELPDLKKEETLQKILTNSLNIEEIEQIALTIQNNKIAIQVREKAKTFLSSAKQSLKVFPSSKETTLLFAILDYILEREK